MEHFCPNPECSLYNDAQEHEVGEVKEISLGKHTPVCEECGALLDERKPNARRS